MAASIPPLQQTALVRDNAGLRDLIEFVGYRPNALATMARRDGLLDPVLQLVEVVLRRSSRLPSSLRFMVACEAARHAGCAYTATHLAHAAHKAGVSMAKLAALDSHASCPSFSLAERAALNIAALTPDGTRSQAELSAARFVVASEHFDADQLAEIAASVAISRLFSTWNGLVTTELEEEPATAMDQIPWLQRIASRSNAVEARPADVDTHRRSAGGTTRSNQAVAIAGEEK